MHADVCYWPKADIRVAPHMSAFGGEADMASRRCKCLLLTQSGHSVEAVAANGKPV